MSKNIPCTVVHVHVLLLLVFDTTMRPVRSRSFIFINISYSGGHYDFRSTLHLVCGSPLFRISNFLLQFEGLLVLLLREYH